jgi:hypothetical protein
MSRWVKTDCRKEVPECFCATGFRYEEMCPDCRDEPIRDIFSRCVCAPDDEEI